MMTTMMTMMTTMMTPMEMTNRVCRLRLWEIAVFESFDESKSGVLRVVVSLVIPGEGLPKPADCAARIL